MNPDNTQPNPGTMNEALEEKESTKAEQFDPDFISIDDPNLKWPPFILAMLRVGRILTQKEAERREITASQISRLMKKYCSEMPQVYTAGEIRQQFDYHLRYFSGGGLRVEGSELPLPYRTIPHFHFTFTKIYRPEGTKANQTELKA